MSRDRLRVLDRAAILEVGGDAGRPEGVAAGGVGESCCLGAALDYSQDVVYEGMRSLLKDIVSEAVRKTIFGP